MDPITEMFNRIKNAQAVGKKTVEVNFSNLKEAVAEILKKEGFIVDCKKRGRQPHQFIKMVLSYGKDKLPALEGFKRVSKPGQRIYKKSHEIKSVRSGYGLAIVSTNQGVMTDKESRKNKVGGEVLVEVW